MRHIYDLAAKFSGLAAFCNVELSDTNVSAALYANNLEIEAARQKMSRVKSGRLNISDDDLLNLSEYFNDLIAKATGSASLDARSGPIRPEDWARPINEFFGELKRHFYSHTEALDRAHSAVIAAMTKLDNYRDKATPLALTHDTGQVFDGTRFPVAAVPVDTITLPTPEFRSNERMLIELTEPVECDSNGWMFFVRNPDTRRTPNAVQTHVWDQKIGNLIRWLPSPFPLSKGFFGPIPGFPCEVDPLEGEYTAYLLIENATANSVSSSLAIGEQPEPQTSVPTYEQTMRLIAQARTLLELGNASKGNVAPPRLLMRRYRVINQ